MAISSVNNTNAAMAQAYAMSFATLNNRASNSNSSNAAGSVAAARALSSLSAYGGGASSSVLSEVLSGMGYQSGDKLSFQTMLDYREHLREEFEAQTRKGLLELGVDEDVRFQVISDGSGGVRIISDSADKPLIEKYFADNPDMVKMFNQIEALTNVEAARKAQGIDVKAMRQRIQVESLSAWFSGTGQSVGSILNYSNGYAALLSGLNATV